MIDFSQPLGAAGARAQGPSNSAHGAGASVPPSAFVSPASTALPASTPPRDLSGPPLSAVLAALNHLLAQQGWARAKLRMFAGRTLRLGVDPTSPLALIAPPLAAVVADDGLVRPTSAAVGRADGTLWFRPSFAALSDGLKGGAVALSRHLRIEGDVMFAATLGELAQHLRWDAEEDASRVIGDIAAHRLFSGLQAARDRLGRRLKRTRSAVVEAMTTEQPMLVATAQANALSAALAELDRATTALEARVQRARR